VRPEAREPAFKMDNIFVYITAHWKGAQGGAAKPATQPKPGVLGP